MKKLGYLHLNNPWRWSEIIEWNFERASEEDFFQMFQEICSTYAFASNRDEKSFQWYFEEIVEKRVIDPEIETKTLGKGNEGVVDWFVEQRKKTNNENLSDYKKLYSLWKKVGIRKGLDVSFYPDDLEEIFN